MRRVLLAIGGTIAGLVALLSFKTHTAPGLPTAAASTGVPAASPAPTGSSAAPTVSTPAAPASHSPAPARSAPATQQVLTGQVSQTSFGPMQVQVTLVNHKIVKVTVLQQTNTGTESAQIDARAIPQLDQETLAAQSARIDAVSGASATSAGYINSLQSALDQA
jgi:uncharacterized protein with FMN-binding domain